MLERRPIQKIMAYLILCCTVYEIFSEQIRNVNPQKWNFPYKYEGCFPFNCKVANKQNFHMFGKPERQLFQISEDLVYGTIIAFESDSTALASTKAKSSGRLYF